MNFNTLRYHLLEKGYTEDEIENDLSDIAEELNDRSKDDDLMENNYAN